MPYPDTTDRVYERGTAVTSTVTQPKRTAIGSHILARWVMIVALFVMSLGQIATRVHVAYYAVQPGPAIDALKLIDATGVETYPSRGRLLLTTASVTQDTMNLWDVLAVWLDADATAVEESALRGSARSDAEVDAANRKDMEESKISAEVATFRALGFDVPIVQGAMVLSTIEGFDSRGKLEPRDVILSVDGRRVLDQRSLAPILAGRDSGDDVQVRVLRGDAQVGLTITLAASLDDPRRPALGIFVGSAFRLPNDVQIDSQEIVGPSAGLVFALALADRLTPEDLTAGYDIAVTGTIELVDGRGVVGPIGEIEKKVRGARAEGADVFIAPASQVEAARAEAPSDMQVFGVATLAEAIELLKGLPEKS